MVPPFTPFTSDADCVVACEHLMRSVVLDLYKQPRPTGASRRWPPGPLAGPTLSTPTRSGGPVCRYDGERGGDEHYDGYFDGIGAEAMGDGEFGGGPWSGASPYACGGAD